MGTGKTTGIHVALLWSPDVDGVPRLEKRGEERESLNVIPMRVTQEQIDRNGPVVVLGQRATERPNPGAGIQDDEVPSAAIGALDSDAGGVATVACGG
jgi:hypothetical protein